MGKHTMHKDNEELNNFLEGMTENRELMVEFCLSNELKVMNIMFRKPLEKTATYRKRKQTISRESKSQETHMNNWITY